MSRNRESDHADAEALPSRRDVLAGAMTIAGAAAVYNASPVQALAQASSAATTPLIIASDRTAVVETTGGKVRGFVSGGIQTFKGIPYAASTEGQSRFAPPSKPSPWAGVRSAMYYGPTCPQGARSGWTHDEEAFVFDWDDGQPGEDCLRVNVWTPGLNDNRKRPVLVWIHGGQFLAGSGQELKSYHGERLSRRGDVVVVSLNHRLNVLGYLDLSAYGQRYADSANAGMLDIVAALQWVRDNIGSFGGDAGNVTIFGQSGGGAKVSTLMAMPAAKGLFHRAAVQSGSGLRMVPAEAATKLAALTLAELGVSAAQVAQLHSIPHARLLEAAQAAQRKMMGSAGRPGGLARLVMADRVGLAAVVDGKHLPHHPFDPTAPAVSAHVPMLIGTNLNEFANEIQTPGVEAITEQDLNTRASAAYGEQAARVVEAYRRAMPGARPSDVFSRISAASQRHNAIVQATRKRSLGAAPAFLYWFTWQTPILDGRPRAFHCAELPFVFDNTDRCAAMTGGSQEARDLAGRISEAWIAFARTGNPNHGGLPKWPAFGSEAGEVMVFDRVCAVKNDPDRTERSTIPTT